VASGQTVPLSGSGTTLAVLGSAAYGTASGKRHRGLHRRQYPDVLARVRRWWSKVATQGTDVAAALPYINNSGGKQTQAVSMYYASAPLQTADCAGRWAAQCQPNASRTHRHAHLAMTVATTSATTVVSLRAHANSQIGDRRQPRERSPLIGEPRAIGAWEQFDLAHQLRRQRQLPRPREQRHVTADNAGASPLIATTAPPSALGGSST